MQSDVFYTLHTESNSTISAVYTTEAPSEFNQVSRGERAQFTFEFPTESLVVESGETYTVESGTTEIFQTVDVKENGTLDVNGTLIETGGNNVAELQRYQDHAGSFATQETLNNARRYRLGIPSGIDITSLVLGIEPSQTLQDNDVPGIWGLVESVSDPRRQALSDERVTVQLLVLDRFSAYTDHTDIQNSLEM